MWLFDFRLLQGPMAGRLCCAAVQPPLSLLARSPSAHAPRSRPAGAAGQRAVFPLGAAAAAARAGRCATRFLGAQPQAGKRHMPCPTPLSSALCRQRHGPLMVEAAAAAAGSAGGSDDRAAAREQRIAEQAKGVRLWMQDTYDFFIEDISSDPMEKMSSDHMECVVACFLRAGLSTAAVVDLLKELPDWSLLHFDTAQLQLQLEPKLSTVAQVMKGAAFGLCVCCTTCSSALPAPERTGRHHPLSLPDARRRGQKQDVGGVQAMLCCRACCSGRVQQCSI